MRPREEAACRRSLDRLDRLESSVPLTSYTILATSASFAAALKHLSRASELDSTNAALYSRRAELLVDLGRHAAALTAIDSYLSRTEDTFESEDVRRAFQLRAACQAAIASD